MSPIPPRPPELSLIRARLTALGWLAAAVAGALVYPLPAIWLAVAMLAYGLLLWKHPASWLLLVPALLPVLDLAPWTGWFFLEEVDLLLLVTLAVCTWRIGAEAPAARLPRTIRWLLGLLACAWLIGMALGLGLRSGQLPALDTNAFSSYFSFFNSLRIGKSLFWLIVLLPLITRSAGPELSNLRRLFVPGMLIGLALVCAVAIRERMLFPGLMNFASDYRITGPFSAMHTGGAALDGYLALAIPFVAFWLAEAGGWRRSVGGLLLLAAAIFIGLATFSRGVYLAYGCGALLFMAYFAWQAWRGRQVPARATAVVAGTFMLTAFALHHVFVTSGFRGLGAGLAVLAAAVLLAAFAGRMGLPSIRRRRTRHSASAWVRLAPAVVIGACLCVCSALFAELSGGANAGIPKGVYLFFGVSMLTCGAGCAAMLYAAMPAGGAGLPVLGRLAAPDAQRTALMLAVAGFIWMAFNAVLVAQHWGGAAGRSGMLPAIAIALVLPALNRWPATPFWRVGPGSVRIAAAFGIMLALAIPLSASYYTGARFATVGSDLQVRLDHWHEALAMMTPDPLTTGFGMGLGRYPETYLWKNTSGEVPSAYRFEHEPGNSFLRLAAPRYERGWGEVVRILQHVRPQPHVPYLMAMDIRHPEKNSGLRVGLCERWLLYAENCVEKWLPEVPADGQWHRVEAVIDAGNLGAGSLLWHRPVQLQMSVVGSKTVVDVDNVSVIDRTSGAELVRNGDFSQANSGWFFSSDHYHLPWHVKNLGLNIYFETGLFGVAAFILLGACIALHLLRSALAGNLPGTVSLVSLSGFMLVGLFDSLLDVPRLALLFFLVSTVAVLQAAPGMQSAQPQRRRRRRRSAPQAETVPA